MNVLNALLKPAAIQRKYESLRRHWKIEEEKENCEEFLKLTSNKKKYRQRRQTSVVHCFYLKRALFCRSTKTARSVSLRVRRSTGRQLL